MAAPPSPTKTWHSTVYAAIDPKRPELSAAGKNVIVTGGGSGIGAAIARSFAEAGAASIGLLGRRTDRLAATQTAIHKEFPKVTVHTYPADVTKASEVDQAFSRFATEVGGAGKVHVVVSNAGIIGPLKTIADVDPEVWFDAAAMTLRGALNTGRAFQRVAAPEAVVIDINSAAGHGSYPGMSAYSSGKAASGRFWGVFAAENPQLRVYMVQPGSVMTDMAKEIGFGTDHAPQGVPPPSDHPSLPAGFSVWLASPEAAFLRGKYLWANWDVEELKARGADITGKPFLELGLLGWPFA